MLQRFADVLLFILLCLTPLVRLQSPVQPAIDAYSYPSVATVNFNGSTLRVFDISGVQFAEPIVAFGDTCDSLKYNNLYLQYQLTLPISTIFSTLESPTHRSKHLGQFALTELLVRANEGLASEKAKVSLMASLIGPGRAQLIFLCDAFARCQQLQDDVRSNPEELQLAVTFDLVGRVGSMMVRFQGIRSANSPKLNCPAGQWVVFQRRVDGSLSFAQNWDAYENGFGNPESNYWMGLKKLSAMTATSTITEAGSQTTRCQLRIETEDFKGGSYWGEFNQFQVLGPESNYQLRVDKDIPGSQMEGLVSNHGGMNFSTYDKNNGSPGDSIARQYGYGGWWHQRAPRMNLNGAYATGKATENAAAYTAATIRGTTVPMKRTLMKFKCD